MGIETVIGLPDELAVEALFAAARLIARHEQDRLAFRIEGEGHSPFTIRRAKAQLLRVGVAGAVKPVNAGPPQPWPELLENSSPISTAQPTIVI